MCLDLGVEVFFNSLTYRKNKEKRKKKDNYRAPPKISNRQLQTSFSSTANCLKMRQVIRIVY